MLLMMMMLLLKYEKTENSKVVVGFVDIIDTVRLLAITTVILHALILQLS